MWFLQTDTLFLIAAFCLGLAALQWVGEKLDRRFLPRALVLAAEAVILLSISRMTALYYFAYIAVGFALTQILYQMKKGRKACMFLFCILAVVPLFLTRADRVGLTAPFIIIGISYNMLKMIDALYYVYYGNLPVKAGVFVGYMMFLPVFTAGPVFRYRDFKAGYENPKALDGAATEYAVQRVIRGFFKKLVLAELFLLLLNYLRELPRILPVSLFIILLSYCVLYFDLSGYSDIAIAFSRVAGIEAPENFKQPWKAPTFTKFWRSWHASVSDFIREHIYVVVVKKKLTKWHAGCIGLITMVVMALWHDFNFYYLLGGLYLGILLMLENFLGLTTVNIRKVGKPYYVFRCVLTNFLFAVNTLFFTLPVQEILPVIRGLARFSIRG